MKKVLIILLAVFMFLVTFAFLIPVSASEYDLFNTGRVTFTVDVPKGFDRIVYVSLMDAEGSSQQLAILPESKYRLVEDIVCGPFQVSGFVENDVWLEYFVLRDQDTITVSQDKDLTVRLKVTTEAPEIIEVFAPETDDLTVPEETIPEETAAPEETEAPTEPEDSGPSDIPDEESDSDHKETKSIVLKLLGSLASSLIFAGIVIVIVYFVRKHLH